MPEQAGPDQLGTGPASEGAEAPVPPAAAPVLSMLSDDDGAVCVDGFCALPGQDAAHRA